MATDFGNLAGRVDQARGSLADAFPVRKPFTPNVTRDSPEALNYARKYGIPPHDLGDNIRRGILDYQLNPESFNLDTRPMANLGMQGFDVSRVVPLPVNLEGTGGSYFPPNKIVSPKKDRITYDTLNILGENQRLIDDFITTTPRGGKDTVKHELIHRAFLKLKKIMEEGRVAPKFSLSEFNEVEFFNSIDDGAYGPRTRTVQLSEEDVTKLLDALSGRKEKTEDYFGNGKGKRGIGKWKNVTTSPYELLRSPDIIKLLETIQQMAIEELRKQGKSTPINFGDVLGKPRKQFAPIPELFADLNKYSN